MRRFSAPLALLCAPGASLRPWRFSAPLALLILATLAESRRFPLEVTSGADSLSHTASSGSTKLAVNSDMGHELQIAGSNVVEVTSGGVEVTGTLTQSNKAYVYSNTVSALSLTTSSQDVTWSSTSGDVVTNGAMSWSNNKEFTPTNSGLYKVTAVITVRLEETATAGERLIAIELKDSSDTLVHAGRTHLSLEDSWTLSFSQVFLGPVVLSLTGGTAYHFEMYSQNTGDAKIFIWDGNSFIVESFP